VQHHNHDNSRYYLNDALRYARLKWHVFPTEPCEKKPLIKTWQMKASIDPRMIRQWWTKWPDANIAVQTGERSGIVVVDIDLAKNGDNAIDVLQKLHDELPITVTSRTGTGGIHLIFSYPNLHIRNSHNKLGVGIDVRGTGGYIIVPPSLHPNGWTYEWELAPWYMEPSPVPEWLLPLICPPEKQVKPRPRKKIKNPNAPEHWLKEALVRVKTFHAGRNETGFWLACQLRDDELDFDTAETVILRYQKLVPERDHAYTKEEAILSLDSAYREEPREPARAEIE
jgi:hypothetical protein